MKVGDILICKKEMHILIFNEIVYTKNKGYKIYNISYYRSIDPIFYLIANNNKPGTYFSNDKNDKNYSYIFEYFYTKEEIRSLKLNSI